MMIDGVGFGDYLVIVALGIKVSGKYFPHFKHLLYMR